MVENAHGSEVDPIDGEEILYRRISRKSGWYDVTKEHPIASEAFRPNSNDPDGISLWRKRYTSIAEIIRDDQKREFFIAEIRAKDLVAHEIEIVPTPLEGQLGHASIPKLNHELRIARKDMEMARVISDLVIGVLGPFSCA